MFTAMTSPLIRRPYGFWKERSHSQAVPKFGNERFDRLSRIRRNLMASFWFRRGFDTKEFEDVATALEEAISVNKPAKVLLIGVADAQEPMSILATVNHLAAQKPLKEVIHLNCVDIRSPLSEEFIEEHASFHDSAPSRAISGILEKVASSSFDTEQRPLQGTFYRLKKPILDYLKKVFADKASTHWDTQIEDFSKTAPSEAYDVILYNNVGLYLANLGVRKEVLSNLCRMVKPGGFLITDGYMDPHCKDLACFNNFTKFKDGIWCKTSTQVLTQDQPKPQPEAEPQQRTSSRRNWWDWLKRNLR
jgi:hypothetical protein